MPAQSEADVLGLELEAVNKRVPVLFDRTDRFWAFLSKKDGEPQSSRDRRVPLKLKPGGRFGHFDPDGGDMGRGSGARYDKALVPIAYLKHGVEWTLKSEWSTDDSRKAVLNSFREELADQLNEFRSRLDAVLMTAGDGVLATVSTYSVGTGTGGADVLTCAAATDGFGVKLLREGQMVNIYDATLATNRTIGLEREITLHDQDGKIIQISPSVAAGVATDKVVISGVQATPPVSVLGVPYHHSNASTGTWLGLPRATVPQIRANRVNAGGSLALPFIRLALNKIGDRVGIDERVKVAIWTHPAQLDAYEQLGMAVTVVNKEARTQGLDLFYNPDAMQMAGVPVKQSFVWDKTRMDFITDAWHRAEQKPVGFHTVDGRKIFEVRGASGGLAAAMLFYLRAAFNAYVDNPAKCSYIDGLTVPAGY